jgi:NTE family protein
MLEQRIIRTHPRLEGRGQRRTTAVLVTLIFVAGAVILAPTPSSAEEPSRPKIALALGGGAALGIAHVGVLKWLEEHRIPVDFVAGTSMGGLIGGSYAVGMTPDEIDQLLSDADWDVIFKPDAPYRQKSFRRKQDARDYPVKLELGLKEGLSLPTGLNPGHHIGVLLSRIALAHSAVADFDDLPIPFRCVAVDMRKNEEVVLDNGPLGTALRATMAIPTFFDPIERDGRLLADGGVLNNLPVDVARAMGADIVIAVRVDSQPPEPPDSALGLGFHAIGMMMDHLTGPKMALADFRIVPELQDFQGTDYRKSAPLVERGYEAAVAQGDPLLELALDEAAWQEHLAARRARIRPLPERVGFYEVRGLTEGDAARIERLLDLRVGEELDEELLAPTLSWIVGTGRYAAAAYGLAERGEDVGMAIAVREKRHAPPVINFSTDLGNEGEDIQFRIGARATFMDLTTYGSELRLDGQLGNVLGIAGELFQPIGGRGFFVSGIGGHIRINENLYDEGRLVAVFRRTRTLARADVGWTFPAAQLRVGYEVADSKVEPRVGPVPSDEEVGGQERIVVARGVVDTRDAAFFPRRGLRVSSRLAWYERALETEEKFGRVAAAVSVPFPVGRWSRGLLRAELDTMWGPDAPAFYEPSLGGPFRLSSFGTDEFRGRRTLLGHVGYLHAVAKLPDPLGDRLFVVGLLEVGSAFEELNDADVNFSATGGLAFDSYFGPVFIGASFGNGGSTRVFFTFGSLVN